MCTPIDTQADRASRRGTLSLDFRPPSAVPFYRANPWFIPAIIKGCALQDKFLWWRARR
ncbi:hypothetical protein MesoLjLc_48940 [Mesorhizobium sp. L-8-10]|uniref:hypothetical protein n=1 Tax=Mesorhizobium sp. L-8-10 TaxID=2744523 RepID=UPI001926D874|nr:hypothetical protein [Mesorhizobium sp. L-8-10]BCH32964.1 hypothetical protein MesoLjLc_48940 [Mesorhizobium sp. L-8-10]